MFQALIKFLFKPDTRTALTKWFMKKQCCPDCMSTEFYEGPTGGCAVNVKCADCGSTFNLALPMFAERI